MSQRIRSTCTLVCALLLVLPSLSLARDSRVEPAPQEPVRTHLGARAVPAPDPLPLNGDNGPGDDDMPNRGGPGGIGTPSRGTITSSEEGKLVNPRDWAAWIRRHVLQFIRAPR